MAHIQSEVQYTCTSETRLIAMQRVYLKRTLKVASVLLMIGAGIYIFLSKKIHVLMVLDSLAMLLLLVAFAAFSISQMLDWVVEKTFQIYAFPVSEIGPIWTLIIHEGERHWITCTEKYKQKTYCDMTWSTDPHISCSWESRVLKNTLIERTIHASFTSRSEAPIHKEYIPPPRHDYGDIVLGEASDISMIWTLDPVNTDILYATIKGSTEHADDSVCIALTLPKQDHQNALDDLPSGQLEALWLGQEESVEWVVWMRTVFERAGCEIPKPLTYWRIHS